MAETKPKTDARQPFSKEYLETQLARVKELEQADHCFLNPAGVKHFTQPFGFEGTMITATDNRSEFKGLNLGEGFSEGYKAQGQDAAQTACEIADHLGIDYLKQFGRGSQLRTACEAIQQHLEAELAKIKNV